MIHKNDIRIIRLPELMRLTGISRSTIYKWVGEGKLPGPFRIGGSRCSGWWEHEIQCWLASYNCHQ